MTSLTAGPESIQRNSLLLLRSGPARVSLTLRASLPAGTRMGRPHPTFRRHMVVQACPVTTKRRRPLGQLPLTSLAPSCVGSRVASEHLTSFASPGILSMGIPLGAIPWAMTALKLRLLP